MPGTQIEEPPEKLLALLYAPMASLFYRVSHRGLDGKFDNRRSAAILIPHITDLQKYRRCYRRYLIAPYRRLSADGLGDAALSAMVELKADDDLEALGIDGCTVIVMGTVTWSKQQQSRTSINSYSGFDEAKLNLFDIACRCLPNRVVISKAKDKDGDQQWEIILYIDQSGEGIDRREHSKRQGLVHGVFRCHAIKRPSKHFIL